MAQAAVTALAICLALPIGYKHAENRQPKEAHEVSADSYGVYSAVLSQRHSSWFKSGRPVRIAALTSAMPSGFRTNDCRARVGQNKSDVQLLNNLIAANTVRQRIEQKLSLPGAIVLIRGKTQVETGSVPGIVFLSAIGFSPDRRHAMVYITNYCGPLCASGSLWKLDKVGSSWKVASDDPICGFIS